MDNHGQRLLRLEDEIKALAQQVAQLFRRVAALEQQMRSAGGNTGAGGGNDSFYFGCTLTGNLSHGTSITGQTIWKMPGRVTVTAVGVIYNDGPNVADDIVAGKTIIVDPNSDGSYTVTQVYC